MSNTSDRAIQIRKAAILSAIKMYQDGRKRVRSCFKERTLRHCTPGHQKSPK
jgi:hypothetical protein